MSISDVIIDPDGDTLIILPYDKEALHAKDGNLDEELAEEPAEEVGNTEVPASEATEECHEFHFKVSMKHLELASPRAKVMFAGEYKEARPTEADGLRHWKFEPLFDPAAFKVILDIVHGRTQRVPRQVSLTLMAGIAAIVDDLECHNAVWFFAKMWIPQLKKTWRALDVCEDLARWILISYIFSEPEMFKSVTHTAIYCSAVSMPTFGLPILPKIIGPLIT
ncbi:hypothetical protein G7Z17_g8926 [Cylindrodendrum hubeiense]|uniref:BTB domain-containing protein n=1 Tax=Cylindrodendrum hubeiense TaxID=595255 RepID=A0A9P5H7P2_9HYPO|nr:hypothetical protein G7Z17_g8926 [Cylindrodendrum hubeiense]